MLAVNRHRDSARLFDATPESDEYHRWFDKHRPAILHAWLRDIVRASRITTGAFRTGTGYKKDVLTSDDGQSCCIANYLWSHSMELQAITEESISRIRNAVTETKTALPELTGNVKNQVASMKSAATRIRDEVNAIAKEIDKAQCLLTTPEFERAVENAERLASALEKIQALQATKISFAVFGPSVGENRNAA